MEGLGDGSERTTQTQIFRSLRGYILPRGAGNDKSLEDDPTVNMVLAMCSKVTSREVCASKPVQEVVGAREWRGTIGGRSSSQSPNYSKQYLMFGRNWDDRPVIPVGTVQQGADMHTAVNDKEQREKRPRFRRAPRMAGTPCHSICYWATCATEGNVAACRPRPGRMAGQTQSVGMWAYVGNGQLGSPGNS